MPLPHRFLIVPKTCLENHVSIERTFAQLLRHSGETDLLRHHGIDDVRSFALRPAQGQCEATRKVGFNSKAP